MCGICNFVRRITGGNQCGCGCTRDVSDYCESYRTRGYWQEPCMKHHCGSGFAQTQQSVCCHDNACSCNNDCDNSCNNDCANSCNNDYDNNCGCN